MNNRVIMTYNGVFYLSNNFLFGLCENKNLSMLLFTICLNIVPGGPGLFGPIVIVCVQRTAGSFLFADPRTYLELLNYYLTLAMSSCSVLLVLLKVLNTTKK